MLAKKGLSRKEQIALTAIDIISEEGTKNLSMVKIAKRIGVTDAALYKHFKTKQEMLLYMVELIDNMLIEKMHEYNNASDLQNPLEKLKHILSFQFHFIEQNKGIPRIIFSEALQYDDNILKAKSAAVINRYLNLIKSIIADAKKRGTIKSNADTETLAFMFMGMIQSTVILWSLGGCASSLKQKEKLLWKNFEKLVK